MPPAKEAQPPAASIAIIKAWIGRGRVAGRQESSCCPDHTSGPQRRLPPPPLRRPRWTSADGKSIQASFLRLEGENVVIQREDGVGFILPLSRLSPESQTLAKNGGK